MRLPSADNAILDRRKLTDYCLSSEHPRGRHKARVFWQALGLAHTDAGWLADTILVKIPHVEAANTGEDQWGEYWRADLSLTWRGRSAIARTIWIVPKGEKTARSVTCWVL